MGDRRSTRARKPSSRYASEEYVVPQRQARKRGGNPPVVNHVEAQEPFHPAPAPDPFQQLDDDNYFVQPVENIGPQELPGALHGPPYFPPSVNYTKTSRDGRTTVNRNNIRSWEGNKPGKKIGRDHPNYRTSVQAHAAARKCPFVERVPGYLRCMPMRKYKRKAEEAGHT